MQVLAGVGVLSSLKQFNGSVLKAVGKPSWRLGLAVVQTVATSVAILAVVREGITAVALAGVAVGLALYPVGFWLVRRLIGIEAGRYAAQFAGPLAAALLCAGAALGLRLAAPALVRRCLELVGDALPGRLRARAPEA
jgi:PST family polysaccharide transporter